jgi:hypothetical protein
MLYYSGTRELLNTTCMLQKSGICGILPFARHTVCAEYFASEDFRAISLEHADAMLKARCAHMVPYQRTFIGKFQRILLETERTD